MAEPPAAVEEPDVLPAEPPGVSVAVQAAPQAVAAEQDALPDERAEEQACTLVCLAAPQGGLPADLA